MSTTLEYALADWALTRFAAAAGLSIDPAFATQASSWKHLVDPSTELFRPRHADGSWLDPFDPDSLEGSQMHPMAGGPGFVEGTAWHYAFYAPHAVVEQAMMTGGTDAYVARLQSLFDSDRFVMWNEPDIGFPYLFTHFPGQAWRTDAAVAAARSRFFGAGHDGIPGNDDAGTLSAWYVFSALGLYPDVPAGDDYALGTPLFDHAELDLAGGTLVIDAPHPTPAHVYVMDAQLNGQSLSERVRHADLVGGGTLHVDLSDTHP